MFLQLVAGGHLLLFVTRASGWFFKPPYPAGILFWSIIATQVVAVLMCAFGWLVEPLSWSLIGIVWAYNLVLMFGLSAVRIAAENFVHHRSYYKKKNRELVNQSLRKH